MSFPQCGRAPVVQRAVDHLPGSRQLAPLFEQTAQRQRHRGVARVQAVGLFVVVQRTGVRHLCLLEAAEGFVALALRLQDAHRQQVELTGAPEGVQCRFVLKKRLMTPPQQVERAGRRIGRCKPVDLVDDGIIAALGVRGAGTLQRVGRLGMCDSVEEAENETGST